MSCAAARSRSARRAVHHDLPDEPAAGAAGGRDQHRGSGRPSTAVGVRARRRRRFRNRDAGPAARAASATAIPAAGVVSRRADEARQLRARQQGEVLASDSRRCCAIPRVGLIVIATRHDEHADHVVRSLAGGQARLRREAARDHWDGLERVVETRSGAPAPLLMVGFNRRFSPALHGAAAARAERRRAAGDQLSASTRATSRWTTGSRARRAAAATWARPATCTTCSDSSPARRCDRSRRQRSIQVRCRTRGTTTSPRRSAYEDGSVAQPRLHRARSEDGLGKERITVFCDGEAYIVDDFKKLTRASDGAVLWQSGEAGQGTFRGLERGR